MASACGASLDWCMKRAPLEAPNVVAPQYKWAAPPQHAGLATLCAAHAMPKLAQRCSACRGRGPHKANVGCKSMQRWRVPLQVRAALACVQAKGHAKPVAKARRPRELVVTRRSVQASLLLGPATRKHRQSCLERTRRRGSVPLLQHLCRRLACRSPRTRWRRVCPMPRPRR